MTGYLMTFIDQKILQDFIFVLLLLDRLCCVSLLNCYARTHMGHYDHTFGLGRARRVELGSKLREATPLVTK